MLRFFFSFSILFCAAVSTAAEIPNVIKTVAPHLVRIETIGGHEKIGNEFANERTSTGILLDQEGYIITSAFNFLHDPASILLIFSDGTKKAAIKTATDHLRMLTLIKANAFSYQEISPLPAREKKSIRIGERCIAVGAALSPTEPNIAFGIVSGLDRIWGKAIQTDAAIGPNNYGGLLIDTSGKVLGIPVPLSMMSDDVAAGADMYDAGVGMSIPFEDVLALLPRLREGNDLYAGFLGFGFKENQTFIGEPVIATVQPNSPAEKVGLMVGDKIMQIDGEPMPTALNVTKNIRQRYANETLKIVFLRNGTEQTAVLTTLPKK